MKNFTEIDTTEESVRVNDAMGKIFPSSPFVLIYSTTEFSTGVVSNVPENELLAALHTVVKMLEEDDVKQPIQH